MSATKWPKWNRYEWDARFTAETDMSETLETEFRPIWLRRETHRWHRYDWDARKKFVFAFWFYTLETASGSKITMKNFFGRLSRICASSGRGVSVISMSTVGFPSQSYRSKLCFKRLTHISLNGEPRVSLISVSIESFWRTHIRQPSIFTKIMAFWRYQSLWMRNMIWFIHSKRLFTVSSNGAFGITTEGDI